MAFRSKHGNENYSYGFLDEGAKREIRRKILKAVAIPGHQIPFASREMPVARGWGTGGLQITLSIIGPGDTLKVIDQGCDGSVNAVNLRGFISSMTGVDVTCNTSDATIIQTRHRIPEAELREDQIMVYQVPLPEPLRLVVQEETETRRMHGEADYSLVWVMLYEDLATRGAISLGAGFPVRVWDRYIMSPSPIPRWDIAKLDDSECLHLFGAGREKRIYAVPPYTKVRPLEFDDVPFRPEDFAGKKCGRCGATNTYLDEVYDSSGASPHYACSDTAFCDERTGAGGKD